MWTSCSQVNLRLGVRTHGSTVKMSTCDSKVPDKFNLQQCWHQFIRSRFPRVSFFSPNPVHSGYSPIHPKRSFHASSSASREICLHEERVFLHFPPQKIFFILSFIRTPYEDKPLLMQQFKRLGICLFNDDVTESRKERWSWAKHYKPVVKWSFPGWELKCYEPWGEIIA